MIKKPKLIYRIFKSLVNFLSILLIALFLDGVIASPIAKSTNAYKTSINHYYSLNKEYKSYEDAYGLYTYDEEGNRKKVEDADPTLFNQDERVIEIVRLAKEDKKVISRINIITFCCSYILSTVILCIVVPVFSKKHTDFGSMIFHIVLTKNDEMMTKKKSLKYVSINTAIHYILGPASLFLINIIDFVFVFIPLTKQRSLLERIFKYDYSLDLDLIESEIQSDEKIFEDQHSYQDQTPRDIIK